jgi:Zn-dependent M28 family amino/carboxypeptidase
MIGRIDENHQENPNYVYLIGSDKLSVELHNVSEQMNDTYIQLDLDYKYNDDNDPNRFYYRSDHYNFAKNDIPVLFYSTGIHVDYHKPSDNYERINFTKLEKVTELAFMVGYKLATKKERIKVDNPYSEW